MSDNVVEDLVALIVRDLKIDPSAIGPETPLFEGGLELDSFAVVELVSRIENHFGFQLADADFRPENFSDLRTLGGVVSGYLAKKSA